MSTSITLCVNYFAVSPMRLWQYLLARWILVVIKGTELSMIASLIIMGTGISYTLLFIGAVFLKLPGSSVSIFEKENTVKITAC
ncbi:MAG: hypothetical protein KJ568_01850 [Actinobacteria bacterium]|nr:hypothetical protein [Actinomycetota bacterium]